MVAAVQPRTAELRLFPRQLRFVESGAPYPAYIGGIGSGKSFAGGAKVISRLARKELGMIAAPTYQMLRDSTLRGFFQLLDDLTIPYTHHKSENVITFQSGHEILCRSLEDPDKARGPNLDYAWVDEVGYVSRPGWQIVKGRVRVGVKPQAWITGTPKGRDYVWEEWERDATGNEFDPTHPLFRVRTEENPELPDGFAASLGYSGQFAAQELGGEFVAFEGLVYPGFSRPTHVRVVDCDGWSTVLGLDVGTRNPTSLSTYRHAGERLHKERELYRRDMSSDTITDAVVAEYRRTNAEYVVIDPSSAGLILSLQERSVRCRKGVNDVLIGISRVTSTLASLTVDPSCVNTVAEFESYRYPDGKRGSTDSPVKENDHCLTAGTMIGTEFGSRPIETILACDRVHTRQGLRPVIAAGLTNPSVQVYTLRTSDGRQITGSALHPIWTENRGWVMLDAMRYGDILTTWQTSTLSASTASVSGAIQTLRIGRSGATTRRTRVTAERESGDFTKKSGKQRTGQFQPVTRFITSITIRSTMTAAISLVGLLSSIGHTTERNHPAKANAHTWKRLDRLRRRGTVQNRAAHGIANMASSHGQSANQSNGYVINAESSSLRSRSGHLIDSVPTVASRHGVAHPASMTLTEPARNAARSFRSIGTAGSSHVRVSVVSVSVEPQKQAVYNLTVADVPEFYANGILVHNSMDELRYVCVELYGKPKKRIGGTL